MKKNHVWILLLMTCTNNHLFAQFTPANQAQVSVTPFVTLDISSNVFTYRYQVVSSSSSAQFLRRFILSVGDVPIPSGGTISQILKPTNKTTWKGVFTVSSSVGTKVIRWSPADVTRSVDDAYNPPSEALKPSESLADLGMISMFLPGPTTFYAQGWVRPVNEEELVNFVNQKLGTHFDVTQTIPPKILRQVYPAARSIKDNSFQGITLTPMQSPVGLSAFDLIDRLISLKHQAVLLGWIFGPGVDGIVNSLDSKLSAAKDSVSRGADTAAANQLNAFINELDAHRGKHLNDNAYFLLKANAQFIISKL